MQLIFPTQKDIVLQLNTRTNWTSFTINNIHLKCSEINITRRNMRNPTSNEESFFSSNDTLGSFVHQNTLTKSAIIAKHHN